MLLYFCLARQFPNQIGVSRTVRIKRFFNTSGVSYRSGGWKEKLPELSPEDAYAALAADGKLIKRPILDDGTDVLVGFREAEYNTLLG